MQDIPLHDIKPLIEVPDNSFIILVIIAGIILVLVLTALAFWAWKVYSKSKALNLRKGYLEKIHNIPMHDAKISAYEISKYARLLAESEKEKSLLEDLDLRLAQYKYKKEVSKIDAETLGQFKVFLEVLDAT